MPGLALARDARLGVIEQELVSDPRVLAWALVGSLGRGEADEWSDIDLMVVVRGSGDAESFIDPAKSSLMASADLLIDARRNAPRGAMSAGTMHLHDGLPVGTDWYVYPQDMAAWPRDASVRFGDAAVPRVDEAFGDWNGRGDRNHPVEPSPAQVRAAQLAMATIVGKYLARDDPQAAPILAWLTGEPLPAAVAVREDQLEQLRGWVRTAVDVPTWLVDAVERYLRLVEATVASPQ